MITLKFSDDNKEDLIKEYNSVQSFYRDKEMFYTDSDLSDMSTEDYNYVIEEYPKNDLGQYCKYEYINVLLRFK